MADCPISPAMLDQSIQNLKEILPIDEGKRTAAEATDVYLSSVRLLLALKADERSITEASRSMQTATTNDEVNVHLWESTPALSAVIRDGALFRVLIQRIDGVQTSNSVGSTAEHSTSEQSFATKKRSMSISEPERKNGLSPMPGQRTNLVSTPQRPKFNEVVFIATVLNSAFRRLDHWPAYLVKVYAADCFGPRAWVDNPMCGAFVDNLKLMHAEKKPLNGVDTASLQDAEVVAAGFQSFESFRAQNGSSTRIDTLDKRSIVAQEPRKLKRQLSSTSWGSLSDVSVQSKKVKSNIPERVSDKKKPQNDSTADPATSREGASKRRLEDVLPDESSRRDNPALDTDSGSERNSDAMDETSTGGELTPIIDRDADFAYPLAHVSVNSSATRDRFIGDNLVAAQSAVVLSLKNRLEVKLKQNSGLVQCLPLFAGIAGVRLHASEKLGKWLQSPGLSNHARTLFSSIVTSLEASDPPLREDLETIDNILAMRLKANQFNTHLSSITKIAARLPFQQVANNMFSYLLRKLIVNSETSSDDMKLVVSVHRAFSAELSYNAIASFLITFLTDAKADSSLNREDRHNLLAKMRRVVTLMESELKSRFEGKRFLGALLSVEVSTSSWSARDEEDKARLMFLGVTLAIAPHLNPSGTVEDSREDSVRAILVEVRKSILTWCVSEYGPRFKKSKTSQSATMGSGEDILKNLSSPQFSSVLDPENAEPPPVWLNTILCLLFIEQPDSSKMKSFLFPGNPTKESEFEWQRELPRIRACCAFGRSVNDDLLRVVLRSTEPTKGKGLDNETALQVVEHLFASCSEGQGGTISIEDPELVWELYRLAQFIPNFEKAGKSTSTPIPRLAYPSLWWRITMLALVVCSTSPEAVGSVMFQEHPTVRALIKMVTSGRFRFPTIDCDDDTKKLMKSEDHDARAKETAVVEEHFLPKQKDAAKKREQKGSRISRRLLKQQQAKEAAEVLEVASRRKKILKKAQKSIMLWDPDGPARKPPQDSVDLLLSVSENFALSQGFRSVSEPDFLLMTIGETSRSSIERAHDWLIPIISELPSTIARLPPNASCFLLLRAYGSGETEKEKLKELSQPLLQHVKDSLGGSFGSSGAFKALDLLLTDVASSKAERRRCARRVFRDALSNPKDGNHSESWMHRIMDLPDAKTLVKCSLPHLTKAATHGKGRELSSVIIALEAHASFAKRENVDVTYCFAGVLIDLMSTRPSVFADAFSHFPQLHALCVDVLHSKFVEVSERSCSNPDENGENQKKQLKMVRMSIPSRDTEIVVPLSMLVAVAVVLSICREDYAKLDESIGKPLTFLSNSLLLKENDNLGSSRSTGLASGALVDEPDTVFVEPWMLLAKSGSDAFARRTALSAPPRILCRLLLCSGLPKASFLTMLGRLGQLGQDSTEVYHELLDSSGLSAGSSMSIARTLIGRLDAYSRLHELESENLQLRETSQSFLSWLSATCHAERNKTAAKSARSKKGKVTKTSKFTLELTSRFLSDLETPARDPDAAYAQFRFEDPCFHKNLRVCQDGTAAPRDFVMDDVTEFLARNLHPKSCSAVESWLQEKFPAESDSPTMNRLDVAVTLLMSFTELREVSAVVSSLVAAWVPRLSQHDGNAELWNLLFSIQNDSRNDLHQLITACMSTWSRSHKEACSAWALKQARTDVTSETTMDWGRLSLYFATVSEQPLTCSTLAEAKPKNSCAWANSKDLVLHLTRIGVRGLSSRVSFKSDDWPPSFSLLFSLAQHGKNQLRAVCEGVLQAIGRKEANCDVLRLCLLRLYLVFPQWMDIGSASARTALISAAGKYAATWTAWKPSLEGTIQDHISALHKGETKVVKVLSKLSRKHPLLVLRELPEIARRLQLDATMNEETLDRKGVIVGTNMNGQRNVRFHRHTVKFSVCHWGYSFLEPLWIVWLDILSSIPKEVLFSCGLEVGLKNVLNVYLQLLSVQLQLMSVKKAENLKEKVSGFFLTFKEANSAGWMAWLTSRIDGIEVRHVLMSYAFVTPQEVRECDNYMPKRTSKTTV